MLFSKTLSKGEITWLYSEVFVIQSILSISNNYVGLFKLVLSLTKVKLPNLSNLVIPQ